MGQTGRACRLGRQGGQPPAAGFREGAEMGMDPLPVSAIQAPDAHLKAEPEPALEHRAQSPANQTIEAELEPGRDPSLEPDA